MLILKIVFIMLFVLASIGLVLGLYNHDGLIERFSNKSFVVVTSLVGSVLFLVLAVVSPITIRDFGLANPVEDRYTPTLREIGVMQMDFDDMSVSQVSLLDGLSDNVDRLDSWWVGGLNTILADRDEYMYLRLADKSSKIMSQIAGMSDRMQDTYGGVESGIQAELVDETGVNSVIAMRFDLDDDTFSEPLSCGVVGFKELNEFKETYGDIDENVETYYLYYYIFGEPEYATVFDNSISNGVVNELEFEFTGERTAEFGNVIVEVPNVVVTAEDVEYYNSLATSKEDRLVTEREDRLAQEKADRDARLNGDDTDDDSKFGMPTGEDDVFDEGEDDDVFEPKDEPNKKPEPTRGRRRKEDKVVVDDPKQPTSAKEWIEVNPELCHISLVLLCSNLEKAGYSEQEARKAIDDSDIDFFENAKTSVLSKNSDYQMTDYTAHYYLTKTLKYTDEQANYAVDFLPPLITFD